MLDFFLYLGYVLKMDKCSKGHGQGKRKRSNLSVNHKSKWYRLHAAQNTVPPNNELHCNISNDEGDELETVCPNSILNIRERTNDTKATTVQSKSSQATILTTSQFQQQTETGSKSKYVKFWTATLWNPHRYLSWQMCKISVHKLLYIACQN